MKSTRAVYVGVRSQRHVTVATKKLSRAQLQPADKSENCWLAASTGHLVPQSHWQWTEKASASDLLWTQPKKRPRHVQHVAACMDASVCGSVATRETSISFSFSSPLLGEDVSTRGPLKLESDKKQTWAYEAWIFTERGFLSVWVETLRHCPHPKHF